MFLAHFQFQRIPDNSPCKYPKTQVNPSSKWWSNNNDYRRSCNILYQSNLFQNMTYTLSYRKCHHSSLCANKTSQDTIWHVPSIVEQWHLQWLELMQRLFNRLYPDRIPGFPSLCIGCSIQKPFVRGQSYKASPNENITRNWSSEGYGPNSALLPSPLNYMA